MFGVPECDRRGLPSLSLPRPGLVSLAPVLFFGSESEDNCTLTINSKQSWFVFRLDIATYIFSASQFMKV